MALRPCLPLLCLVVLCSCGREAETEIAAGPYLLDVAPAEATVLWVTSEPADTTVECWTGESLPTTHIDERTTVHRVRLTGLPSDTAVRYRVGSGGAHSAVHSFRTAPREERPFTFVVFGDTGGAPERLAALAEATRAHDPAFVVHAGGYTAGEGGESAWRRQFFGPAGDLLASRALVPAPGPAAGGSATFARLFPTAGGTPWRRHRFLHVELFALDAREGIAVGDEQYRWLEGALRRSDAQWKIIVLHGVLFPGAGGRARADLRRALYPLLLRARADLVFAAGSAACARTAPIGSGDTPAHNALVSFTITATPDAGPEPRREPWLADAAARPGYLRVEVDDEQLTIQALDARGTTFDAVTLEKAGSLRDRAGALSAEALEGLFAFLPPDGFRVRADAAPQQLTVTVANPYDTPIEGTLHWQIRSQAWRVEPPSLDLGVPPLGHQQHTLTVALQGAAPDRPPLPSLLVDGRRLAARRSPFHAEPASR